MKTKSRRLIGILTFSILLVANTPAGGAEGSYHFLKEIAVGGEGGWDYSSVDEAGRRLYVVTTNLDAQRTAIWDMGKIADSRDPGALELFRNVLTASAFLIMHDAGVPGTKIDMAELFMKTTIGVTAGRFQMTHADAEMLDSKKMTREEYFVRKVIY